MATMALVLPGGSRRLLRAAMIVFASIAAPVVAAGDDVWLELFSHEANEDPAGLAITLGPPSEATTLTEPGRRYQVRRVEFTSFQWAGESWRHGGWLMVPKNVPDAMTDVGVVVARMQPGPEPDRYADAALALGATVLLIDQGNPGTRYGIADEGNLMGYGMARYLETGDARWHGYAWLGRAIVRGVTVLTETTGGRVRRAMVTGCSKRGAASYIAAAADRRVVGAYPTCTMPGNAEEVLLLKAARWGSDYQPEDSESTNAPAFVSTRRQLLALAQMQEAGLAMLHDPGAFPERYAGKRILNAKGTNDPLFPPFADRVSVRGLPETVRILNVPNTAHTSETPWHFEGWRMWVAHVFSGRPLTEVRAAHSVDGDALRIHATVATENVVRGVRVWWASDELGAFLDPDWQSVEMGPGQTGEYVVDIPVRTDGFTLYFVEVRDDAPGSVPGVVTSLIQEFAGERPAPGAGSARRFSGSGSDTRG